MSNWQDELNGSAFVLSTTRKYEGAKSLRIHHPHAANAIKILTQTIAASPKHVNFDFWAFAEADDSSLAFGLVTRYQDVNNFYWIEMRFVHTGNVYFRVAYREAGADTEGAVDTSNAFTKNSWVHWKVLFCVISNTAYAYLYKEVSGSWVLMAESVLATEKFSGGGGAGIGCFPALSEYVGKYVYLDNTKIYYV